MSEVVLPDEGEKRVRAHDASLGSRCWRCCWRWCENEKGRYVRAPKGGGQRGGRRWEHERRRERAVTWRLRTRTNPARFYHPCSLGSIQLSSRAGENATLVQNTTSINPPAHHSRAAPLHDAPVASVAVVHHPSSSAHHPLYECSYVPGAVRQSRASYDPRKLQKPRLRSGWWNGRESCHLGTRGVSLSKSSPPFVRVLLPMGK